VSGSSIACLTASIAQEGYAFMHAGAMRELLVQIGPLADWPTFAGSWNDLGLDRYMADGGRYRRRRHAVYEAAVGAAIVRAPHQPHYQSRVYNSLNGGVARWFDPIDATIGNAPTMSAILACSRSLFEAVGGAHDWHIEVHQFRIAARAGEQGRPTPEGVHRDGVDYVLVLLVDRQNIASGVTTVHRLDSLQLGSFTLTTPLDAAWLDDAKVAHGVTAIEPLDPARPAYRDVLVVTWRHADAGG
jgi:hypothetical protein